MRKQENPDSLTKLCKIPECTRGVRTWRGVNASSYCTSHAGRVQAYGLFGKDIVKCTGVGTGWNGKGWTGSNGYIRTMFYGVDTYVHRLVYLLEHGELPPKGFHVHHRDGNKRNNHPSNLVAIKDTDHHRLHRGPRSKRGRFLPKRRIK